MKTRLWSAHLLVLTLLLTACSNNPDPINYGTDACHFCRMTIVDQQHAAQVVTIKGRNYKYDAIECMLHDLSNWDRPEAAQVLVADYAAPGVLSDALEASYLISKEIPSPMGAYLSAFSSQVERDKTHGSLGGDKLTWEEVKIRINKKASAKN